ncbi:MAG: SUMF1/EgtB/PvdO family nonheme iron enzyme, partial [Myxococcota bacterium]|nr:SUMF1/EgtB/PvdO family nonheme iron enzyme [Myxococcota bacterium]
MRAHFVIATLLCFMGCESAEESTNTRQEDNFAGASTAFGENDGLEPNTSDPGAGQMMGASETDVNNEILVPMAMSDAGLPTGGTVAEPAGMALDQGLGQEAGSAGTPEAASPPRGGGEIIDQGVNDTDAHVDASQADGADLDMGVEVDSGRVMPPFADLGVSVSPDAAIMLADMDTMSDDAEVVEDPLVDALIVSDDAHISDLDMAVVDVGGTPALGGAETGPVPDAATVFADAVLETDDARVEDANAAQPAADAGLAPDASMPVSIEGYTEIRPALDDDDQVVPFLMGSPEDEPGRHIDETQRSVYLTHAFWMKETEVTLAEWAEYFGPFAGVPVPELNCPTCPIAGLNFFNALEFANRLSIATGLTPCYRLNACTEAEPGSPGYICAEVAITAASGSPYDCEGYRLPTEAEWAYAARAGTANLLPSGAPDVAGEELEALYADMKLRACADVGQSGLGGPAFAAINDCANYEARRADGQCDDDVCLNAVDRVDDTNGFGLSGMLGQVSEWVWDAYGVPDEGPWVDPIGADGVQRVIRGGSYRTVRSHIRLAFRSMALPSAVRAPAFHDGIGFRLVRTNHAQVWTPPADVDSEGAERPEDPVQGDCRQVRRYLKEVFISSADYHPDAPYVGAGALSEGALSIDGEAVPPSVDDGRSTMAVAASALAKANAINDIYPMTTVRAIAGASTAVGRANPVRAVTLDLQNHLVINGSIIAGIDVLDGDAAPGPVSDDPADALRRAVYDVDGQAIPQGETEHLVADDVVINGITIRPTNADDDVLSSRHAASSAIAKAAAINEATQETGVVAEARPAVIRGTSNLAAVELDAANNLAINGVIFCDVDVRDGDAGGPDNDDPVGAERVARMESARPIHVNGNAGLAENDVFLNGIPIPATTAEDDQFSTLHGIASAIAKASAINRVVEQTGVHAFVLPTRVTGQTPIRSTSLDSTNGLVINGIIFCDVNVNDLDAGGPESDRPEDRRRRAKMTSSIEIRQRNNEGLLAGDLNVNGVPIRPTTPADDDLSTMYAPSSAIAKAAAINEAVMMTGVEAYVLPTELTGAADIAAVNLDDANSIRINNVTITGLRVEDGGGQNLLDLINESTAQTGIVATLRARRLHLSAADGRNIVVETRGNGTRLGLTPAPTTIVRGARLRLESASSFTIDGAAFMKLGDLGSPGKTIACAVRADGQDNLRSIINASTRFTGVAASLDDAGRLILSAEDGRNIDVSVYGAGTRLGLPGGMGQTVYGGRLAIESPNVIQLAGGNLSKLGDLGGAGRTLACPVRRDGTDNLRSAINAQTAHTGVTADLDDRGRIRLSSIDGRNIEYFVSGNATRLGLSWRFGQNVVGGRLKLHASEAFILESPTDQL